MGCWLPGVVYQSPSEVRRVLMRRRVVAACVVVGSLREVRRLSAQDSGDSGKSGTRCWSLIEVKGASG